MGVLKVPWAFQLPARCLKGTRFPWRCLRGASEVLEEPQSCHGGLIGASIVPLRSDIRLVGALEAPWRCSRGALEVPQKSLGRAPQRRLRTASEP